MKKEQSLQLANGNGVFEVANYIMEVAASRARGLRNTLLEGIASLYSRLLEEEISPRRTARILNAQAAFVCLLLVSCCSLLLSVLSLAWFVTALLQCRETR